MTCHQSLKWFCIQLILMPWWFFLFQPCIFFHRRTNIQFLYYFNCAIIIIIINETLFSVDSFEINTKMRLTRVWRQAGGFSWYAAKGLTSVNWFHLSFKKTLAHLGLSNNQDSEPIPVLFILNLILLYSIISFYLHFYFRLLYCSRWWQQTISEQDAKKEASVIFKALVSNTILFVLIVISLS